MVWHRYCNGELTDEYVLFPWREYPKSDSCNSCVQSLFLKKVLFLLFFYRKRYHIYFVCKEHCYTFYVSYSACMAVAKIKSCYILLTYVLIIALKNTYSHTASCCVEWKQYNTLEGLYEKEYEKSD